ncbi:MAG: LTA synthase family protein [Bacteroidota bacterium]|nr:LTA synthase family protein [Bacteroidota bacterium]
MLIFLGGLHFDLTAVLYTNMLFIVMLSLPFNFRFNKVYKLILKWIFFITNGIALAFNTADFIYYRFTLSRTTLNIFSQFGNENNLWILIPKFLIDYWYATLFYIFIMFLLVKGFNRIKIERHQMKKPIFNYISGILAIPIIVILFVGGIRGDFRHSTHPITIINAGEYATVSEDMNIILNTPFAIYRTINKPTFAKINYFKSEQELEKIYTPVHNPLSKEKFKNQNVVIIILESFSREFFGVFNKSLDNGKYKGYTPFLDSLIGVSKTYYYAFANGRRSIDALPSVTAGIPSVQVPFVLSHNSTNKINGLGQLLKSKGYHTSFFHGAPNGSMGFKAFTNLTGYDHYFGKSEYEQEHGSNDFDGYWGIWDEKFFSFFADKLNTFPQPFHSVIFSVSSHHPYNLPKNLEKSFKGGSMLIYKTIEYTDYSLKEFFKKASSMPWFKNTLFVITADHCSAEIKYSEYRNADGFFKVPLIFYSPKENFSSMEYEIAQQTDIMPTVLGYLNYDKNYVAFGKNLFDPSTEKFAFNYLDNNYQLFSGDYLLLFDGNHTPELYNYKSDRSLKNNIYSKNPEIAEKMEIKIKAIIQQYNNRMRDNRLIIKPS